MERKTTGEWVRTLFACRWTRSGTGRWWWRTPPWTGWVPCTGPGTSCLATGTTVWWILRCSKMTPWTGSWPSLCRWRPEHGGDVTCVDASHNIRGWRVDEWTRSRTNSTRQCFVTDPCDSVDLHGHRRRSTCEISTRDRYTERIKIIVQYTDRWLKRCTLQSSNHRRWSRHARALLTATGWLTARITHTDRPELWFLKFFFVYCY